MRGMCDVRLAVVGPGSAETYLWWMLLSVIALQSFVSLSQNIEHLYFSA